MLYAHPKVYPDPARIRFVGFAGRRAAGPVPRRDLAG